MNKSVLFSLILLLTGVFFACVPSQDDKALLKINEAKSLISKGDTLKATAILSTIPSLFPKAKTQIGVSKNLYKNCFQQLTSNRKMQFDANEKLISELSKHFKKEKTEFDTYNQFLPLSMSHSNSWNKSFLQVNLDERGELFLTSHYMGKEWLKHTAIRVYDGGLQAKSGEVMLDDPNNRESDFLDYKWEKVAYTNGKADQVIKFIADNSDRNLKCTYLGENNYYIILEDYNKTAIKEAYLLSNAIKRNAELTKQIKELEAKLK